MAKSNLSLLGLYQFNSDIFDGLNVPSGLTKSVAVDQIIFDCAELELLYPDYDFMKAAITHWSLTMQNVWQKLYNTTILDYNPIWNKDGTVTETEVINKDSAASGSNSTNGKSNSQSLSEGTDATDQDSTTTNSVAAFNSSSFENKDKTVLDSTIESKTTNNNVDTSEVESQGSYQDNINNNEVRSYERKEQGNIGVTTTQSMIEEEREVDLFNMYEVISNDFRKRFCLMVY